MHNNTIQNVKLFSKNVMPNLKSSSEKRAFEKMYFFISILFNWHWIFNMYFLRFIYSSDFSFLNILYFYISKIIVMIMKLCVVLICKSHIHCDEYKTINDIKYTNYIIQWKENFISHCVRIIFILIFCILIIYILLLYRVDCNCVYNITSLHIMLLNINDRVNNDYGDLYWNYLIRRLFYIYQHLLLLLLFDIVVLIIISRFIHIKFIFYILCIICMELCMSIFNIIFINIILSGNQGFNVLNIFSFQFRHIMQGFKYTTIYDFILVILSSILFLYTIFVLTSINWLCYMYIQKHTVKYEELTNVTINDK